jgi:site-specific recombinase XerD
VKLFIDTSATVFLAGGAPAPVVDYETKRPKVDQASGEPLYVPLAAITQLDVRSWVAELSGRGLTPATVNKTYQVFGKVMGAAVDAGYLAQTPCRNVPLPKVEREEMRFLTPAEIIALADAIRPLYRTLVLVARTAACGSVS